MRSRRQPDQVYVETSAIPHTYHLRRAQTPDLMCHSGGLNEHYKHIGFYLRLESLERLKQCTSRYIQCLEDSVAHSLGKLCKSLGPPVPSDPCQSMALLYVEVDFKKQKWRGDSFHEEVST